MRHSRTVEDALRGLVRYRHIGDRGGATALVNESPARAVLGYSVYSSNTPALRHIYDGATVIALRILRELCGPAWKPIEVTIPHNAPVDPSPFHQVFGPRVRFDADRSGVVFASRWLRQRIEGADPARCRDLEAQLRRAASVEAGGMTEQVRRAMHSLSAAGTPRSGAVAGLLGLHERSLRRRLLDEGMTFQQLTRRVQFEIAQQLLEDTTLEVANVAAALHFSDATAFSRAFKSWSNMTPSAWRAGKRAKPARRLATLSSQPRDGR